MALAADRNTNMMDGEVISLAVAAATKIYAGGIVVVNATGYADKGQAALNLTYMGRAEEQIDNLAGADGDKNILVRREKAFKFKNSAGDAVDQASVGKVCYIEDDEFVSKTDASGTRSPAGIVVGLDSDGVWIEAVTARNLKVTASLDFPSIASVASADLTINVPGAVVGDSVSLGLPAAPAAGLVFNAFVSAAGVVTVRASNITAAAVDAAAANYQVAVIKA